MYVCMYIYIWHFICVYIRHFRESCPGDGFRINILEIFEENGYTDNDIKKKPCPIARQTRLDTEDFWMKKLRTIFPWGLNEKAKNNDHNIRVGKLYPSITSNNTRILHCRNNKNNHAENFSHVAFFQIFDNLLTSNLTNGYYEIRTYLNRLKRKTLKKIASLIISKIHWCHSLLFLNNIIYTF